MEQEIKRESIYSKNPYVIFTYRLIGLLFSLYGLIAQACVMGDFGKFLVYFTNQTNIFVAILFLVYVIKDIDNLFIKKNNTNFHVYSLIEMLITLYITVTITIYWSMLYNIAFVHEGESTGVYVIKITSNLTVHGICPIMAIAHWVIFSKHGYDKYLPSLVTLIYPILYIGFLGIRSSYGPLTISTTGEESYYPYPFIEFNKIGVTQFSITIVVLTIVFALLGLLYTFIDLFISKKLNKENNVKNN